MGRKLINIEFSYNGNLGRLQQRTIDNKIFSDSLLRNDVIDVDEWMEINKEILGYFNNEIKKVLENPMYFIDTIGG